MAARGFRMVVLAMATVLLGASCNPAPSASAGANSPGVDGTHAPSGTAQSPSATSGAGLPPEFQHVYDIPTDPVAITPILDDAHAAEADIPVAGGSLVATAADGTKFELTVPADALSQDAHLRMIPVTSIEGMPFGSAPYAVQLEPEGLHFLDFVTLTITPPSTIPVDQQVLFGWQGGGENLTLALPADKSAAIAIKLLHFSGAGVTAASSAQVVAAQPRIGASAEARITSAIAAELGRARQAALAGAAGAVVDYDAIFGFLAQYFEQVVKPRMAAAGRSCADGTFAIQTYLGYHRQVQLLGAGDRDDMSDQPDLVKLVGEVCVREEYQNCHDNHVIQNMVPTWLGWERNFQLLGVVDQAASDGLEAYVRKCLVFEMRFESQAALNGSGGWDSSVRSSFELRFDPDQLRFIDMQAELDNFLFKFKAPASGCTVTSTPGGGLFNAITFKYFRATKSRSDMVGYVRDLEFGFNPGATSESVKITCPKAPPVTIRNAGFWSGTWLALHRGEGGIVDPGNGQTSYVFTASDWDILGGAYYAKKEWIKSGNGLTEAGTLKLYHTPE
jgi:hypothetical protein